MSQLAILLGQRLLPLPQRLLPRIQHSLLGVQRLELLVDQVLALGEALFLGAEFLSGLAGVLLELLALADKSALGLGLGLGDDLLPFGLGCLSLGLQFLFRLRAVTTAGTLLLEVTQTTVS